MRALTVFLGASVLIACNPPADTTPGAFETVSLSVIDNPDCVFRPVGEEEGVLFATYRDNPDYMAMARYKGETVKLVPREVPTFEGNSFDVTYEVIDYLKWQVRAVSEDGTGELRLIRDGQVTDVAVAMQGSCGI